MENKENKEQLLVLLTSQYCELAESLGGVQ